MNDLRLFVEKYTGKKVDFDSVNGGQCTDLYRQYCKEVLNVPQSPPLGVNGGAADIWTTYLPEYFDAIKNTPEGVPLPGDILIWNRKMGGGYGHVAICISADTFKMTSFEQNWSQLSKCEVVTHPYTNLIGWLHPKVNPSVNPLLKYTEEEMTVVRLERDKNFNDKRLAEEKVQQLTENLSQEQSKSKAIQDNFNRFVSDVAKIITSPEDTVSILSILPNYAKSSDELSKCKDLYERENKAHQKDLAESREQLKTLSDEIADMKEKHQAEINDLNIQHQKQLDYILQKVDRAITEKEALEKQVKQYGSFIQTLNLIKSFFAKGKQ